MYMEINESEQERIQRLEQERLEKQEEEKDFSFSSEVGKEIGYEVAIDSIAGIAQITMPLEELQILIKVFKGLEKTINNEKGILR